MRHDIRSWLVGPRSNDRAVVFLGCSCSSRTLALRQRLRPQGSWWGPPASGPEPFRPLQARPAFRRAATLGALVLTMGLVPLDPAWSGWRSPQTVVSGSPLNPELATDREGRGIVAYETSMDPIDELWVRRITSRGALRAPVEVGPSDQTNISSYDVALDDDGDAVVVWSDHTFPAIDQIFARRISSTGTLGPVVRVSDPAEKSWSPELAITPLGVATIVYDEPAVTQDDVDHTIVARLGRDNQVGTRTILPQNQYPSHPVASRSGHVAFALSSDTEELARAVRVDPDGDVHTRTLTPDLPGTDGMADVALDRRGNVHAVVTRSDSSRAWVRIWHRDGSLGPPRRVTPSGEPATYLLIRTDLAGDSVVLWSRWNENKGVVQVAGRTWQHGSLGKIARLGRMNGGEPLFPGTPSWDASLDDDGDGVLAWHVFDYTRGKQFLHVAHVTHQGQITPFRELGHGLYPHAASTPSGRNLLAHLWVGGSGPDEKILLRIDD
jgi:hypothetical protein